MGAEQSRNILAIDPGTTQSAHCMMTQDYGIISHGKQENDRVLKLVTDGEYDELVIEYMEPRHTQTGFIGAETLETCYWIGRYEQAAVVREKPVYRVYRQEERSRLIPTKKNKLPPLPADAPKHADGQIKAALVRRFASHDMKHGKGTAKNKDKFYGFRADEWSAFAVGVVYLDREKGTKLEEA